MIFMNFYIEIFCLTNVQALWLLRIMNIDGIPKRLRVYQVQLIKLM